MGIDYSALAHPKGPTRKRIKGRKTRQERAVTQSVRAQCVERDGHCRLGRFGWSDVYTPAAWLHVCVGPSEWAHVRGHRRSQTRGQAAFRRHTTKHSLMLCQRHHGMEERGELQVGYITDRGCDGPLSFTIGEWTCCAG
jgi:hypothetical protein